MSVSCHQCFIFVGNMVCKYTDKPFKALGIWFSKDFDEMIRLNYEERLKHFTTVLNIWRQRDLSIKGKITILKTLAMPVMSYVCKMLFVPDVIIKEIDILCLNFYGMENQQR